MLAVFLPVVAGPGGIAGTQTVTLLGLALAVLVGAMGYLWKGSIGMATALAIAIVGKLLVAALAGAGVPLALRRFGGRPGGVISGVRHDVHRCIRVSDFPGDGGPAHILAGVRRRPDFRRNRPNRAGPFLANGDRGNLLLSNVHER
jgi:hypothetical protein